MIKFSKHIANNFPPSGHFGMAVIKPLKAELINRLQSEEVVEMEKFSNKKRKREYLSSRLLLKEMAYDIGLNPAQFQILKDELGKPHGYYKNTRYDISIAHTNEYVMCGLASDFEIGVDLEPAERDIPENLKKRILHASEEQMLADISALRIWTMKEALIKLEGSGLRINMNEIAVHSRNDTGFYAELNNEKIAKICNFKSDKQWISIAYYSQ